MNKTKTGGSRIYLALAWIGFILPNIWVMIESFETGNYFLYTKPLDTIQAMFANRISSIFAIDLLFTVLVFLGWSFWLSKTQKIRGWAWVCFTTFLFGLAGAFPLFLYFKSKTSSHEE